MKVTNLSDKEIEKRLKVIREENLLKARTGKRRIGGYKGGYRQKVYG